MIIILSERNLYNSSNTTIKKELICLSLTDYILSLRTFSNNYYMTLIFKLFR